MKITVDVDCTPDEARQFMGLPDLSPLHSAYVDRMKMAIEQGITPDMISSVLTTWGPMGEAGFSMWKQMLDQMNGGATR